MNNPSALQMNSGSGSVNSTNTNGNSPAKGDAFNQKNWVKNAFGTVIRDVRGRPIQIGKRIAYPSRHGSFMGMNVAKVISYDDNTGKLTVKKNGATKNSQISRLDLVVTIS